MDRKRILGVLSAVLLAGVSAGTAKAATDNVLFGTLSSFNDPSDLDLTGDFVYAINVGTDAASYTLGDATFTNSAAGYTVASNQLNFLTNNVPSLGNANLNTIMSSIAYGNNQQTLTVTLAVTPDTQYKLQTLHWENFWQGADGSRRGENLLVDGALAVENLNVTENGGASAKVFTYSFTTGPAQTVLTLDFTTPTDNFNDKNPTLNALTLENVTPIPAPAALPAGLILMGLAALRRNRR
jgi:hypothetical protein